MARKKKQSQLEDIIGITAMLPWWVGVLLALVAYLVLHHYATAEVAAGVPGAKLGANVVGQIGQTLAMFGQYLLPFAFIVGAGAICLWAPAAQSVVYRCADKLFCFRTQ